MNDINRRFVELLGPPLCWHEEVESHDFGMDGYSVCSCGEEDCYKPNPDFIADPRLVLVEMMKREDWKEFVETAGVWSNRTTGMMSEHILIDYILNTTGLLVTAAVEWLERECIMRADFGPNGDATTPGFFRQEEEVK